MRGSTWDTNGGVTIEELTDDRLPQCVRGRAIDNVDIEYRSTGYYEPASMYGGPDNLGWPAEGDEERTMVSVVAFDEDGDKIPLTEAEQQAVFDTFQKEVDADELPYNGGDESEYADELRDRQRDEPREEQYFPDEAFE